MAGLAGIRYKAASVITTPKSRIKNRHLHAIIYIIGEKPAKFQTYPMENACGIAERVVWKGGEADGLADERSSAHTDRRGLFQ